MDLSGSAAAAYWRWFCSAENALLAATDGALALAGVADGHQQPDRQPDAQRDEA